ncbi:MAG TPA: response regulator [Mycobacteriales bacterium]|nr:response regulator [Mycobacteriales bacterium]
MPLALVVDDELSIRTLIEVTLQLEGFDTIGAGDGETALLLAAERRPDVITLDVMMPGMDGWEVAERLEGSGIPIVIVSGKTSSDLETDAGRHRAAAVIGKPFDFLAFVETVRSVLNPAPEVPAPRAEKAPKRAVVS